MRNARTQIGGFGNLMFKEAFLLSKALDGEIPDQYVQGEKYFKAHKDKIKEHFSDGIGHIDKVAIHVRRGDYLNNKHFHVNLTDTDYYKRAIELFPDEQFLVFCKDNQDYRQDREDQRWCYEYFKPLLGSRMEMQTVYTKEHEDFNAMASCKAIIGANSSFSWWAAYLNPHDGKKVFPKQWFTDGIQRTELLPEWTLI
jgi:hypothetical protein